MPGLRIKVNGAIFTNFDPKIGYHGNVPWAIEKRIKSAMYDQST